MQLPIEVPKCHNCGSEDTMARVGLADEKPLPGEPFIAMEKKITPIQDFLTISTPSTKVLVRYYDTCAKCGIDRCVRVEKGTIPTAALMKMMGMTLPNIQNR